MTASDFIHVQGLNIDTEHPHGDLDRIQCGGTVPHSGNDLWGYDIAYLMEHSGERYCAVQNKTGHRTFKFSRTPVGGNYLNVSGLKTIVNALHETEASALGGWFPSPVPLNVNPFVVQGNFYDTFRIYADSMIDENKYADYGELDEDPSLLRKSTVTKLYNDFKKADVFGSYLDKLSLPFVTGDYDIILNDIQTMPRIGTNVIYSRTLDEQHLSDGTFITSSGTATAKKITNAPTHSNQYWDGSWLRNFITLQVISVITGCGVEGCPYCNDQTIQKLVADNNFGINPSMSEMVMLMKAKLQNYLNIAGVTILEDHSTPKSDEGTHRHRQYITVTIVDFQPLMALRNHAAMPQS